MSEANGRGGAGGWFDEFDEFDREPHREAPARPAVAEPRDVGTHDVPPPRAASPRRRRVRQRRIVLAVAALVFVVAVLAAFAVGPAAARNLATSVPADDTTAVLSNGGDTATVLVPAGWHLVRPVGQGDRLALETPDSRFEIALTLTHRPGAESAPDLTALAGDGGAALVNGDWSREQPAPSLEVTYGRLALDPASLSPEQPAFAPFADGSPTTVALVATAHPVPASPSGAVVDVVASVDGAPDAYLAEFARIVGSVVFS